MSAQACGCDAGAKWICEQHRARRPDVGTEALTHAVPFFTRHKDVQGAIYEETVCGSFVGWTAIAPAETEPTCPDCRVWLGLQEEVTP